MKKKTIQKTVYLFKSHILFIEGQSELFEGDFNRTLRAVLNIAIEEHSKREE